MRVTREEKEQLYKLAEAREMSLSDLLREKLRLIAEETNALREARLRGRQEGVAECRRAGIGPGRVVSSDERSSFDSESLGISRTPSEAASLYFAMRRAAPVLKILAEDVKRREKRAAQETAAMLLQGGWNG